MNDTFSDNNDTVGQIVTFIMNNEGMYSIQQPYESKNSHLYPCAMRRDTFSAFLELSVFELWNHNNLLCPDGLRVRGADLLSRQYYVCCLVLLHKQAVPAASARTWTKLLLAFLAPASYITYIRSVSLEKGSEHLFSRLLWSFYSCYFIVWAF